MNRQDHSIWLDRLSDHLDGGLPPDEAEAMEAHLAGCATCRETLADLRDLAARARALGPVEPGRDLWPGIAAALGAPLPSAPGADVLEFPGPGLRNGPSRLKARPGVVFTRPQLAAAAVVLVSLSAAATWWAGIATAPRDVGAPGVEAGLPAALAADVSAPPADLAEELAGLEVVLAEARARLDPNTVRILEKNLGVIERAIDESVRALAVDPDNAFVRAHLERAWREKADFLREASLIAGWEG